MRREKESERNQVEKSGAVKQDARRHQQRARQQRDGGAALIISPTCTNLIRAMQSRYRYARTKGGILQPVPEKNHPHSDIADALQYAVLGHSVTVLARLVRVRHDNKPQRPRSSAGWT